MAETLLLRSRTGLVLTALRDDETGARSIGAKVARTQRLVFMVAAAGCGAAERGSDADAFDAERGELSDGEGSALDPHDDVDGFAHG